MSIGMRIINGLLLAVLALAGTAVATNGPCPECDEDGTADEHGVASKSGPGNESGSYHSVDAGVVTDHAETLGDTDLSVGDSDDPQGFWAWVSLCLSAFVEGLEDILGFDVDVDANVEAFVNEHGADLDATVTAPDQVCDALDDGTAAALGDDGTCALGFDRSKAGDLDGQTWEAMGEADAVRHDLGLGHLNETTGVGGEDLPEDTSAGQCVHAPEVTLTECE